MNYIGITKNYFIGCVKKIPNEELNDNNKIGKLGILRNHMHQILSLEDIQKYDFKFLRIKNFWGTDSNWSGPFSKNSDELDKYKNLREDLTKKYLNDPQSIYFIKYENFIKEFSKIYIVKLFNES